MEILLLLVSSVLLVIVIVLGFVAWRWSRRIDDHITQPPPPVAVLQGARSVAKGRVLTIEILNPLELAASQNWVAGIASSLAPALVTKIVYERAAKMMKEELGKFGVEAVVQIQTGVPPSQPAASPKASTSKPSPSKPSTPKPPTAKSSTKQTSASRTGEQSLAKARSSAADDETRTAARTD
ncbi:hypothetical protein [Antrihabitans stalactiti]|uniref:Uncharacterized protein n=1 Tax=Antrihabitans stalactiti TaxID=2584121 RepID=A0A848KNM3_9NOCA|nr:hypothetical protein [Antrihabitans stalactiti]NMN98534.1 hypothetical protein [Antrihabitans stalactiti]